MGSGFLLAIVLGLWVIVLYPTFAKNRVNSNETNTHLTFHTLNIANTASVNFKGTKICTI